MALEYQELNEVALETVVRPRPVPLNAGVLSEPRLNWISKAECQDDWDLNENITTNSVDGDKFN